MRFGKLIESDGLAKRLNGALAEFTNMIEMPIEDRLRLLVIVSNVFQDQPEVEAKPMAHGQWIHCNGTTEMWHCSECGAVIMYNENPRTNHQYHKTKQKVHECNKYCRNCGANMCKKEGENVAGDLRMEGVSQDGSH